MRFDTLITKEKRERQVTVVAAPPQGGYIAGKTPKLGASSTSREAFAGFDTS